MTTNGTIKIINQNCHACNGTGEDAAFGGDCSECARTETLAQRRFDAPTNRNDRAHTPGERLDGRTFGGTVRSDEPTDKQLGFIRSLLGKADRSNERTAAECETIEMLIETGNMTKKAASASIDLLLDKPKVQAARPEPKRSSGPTAPGFFARGDDLWKVKATKAGKLWAHRKTNDGWEFDKRASFDLSEDDRLTVEQAAAFGHRTGQCMICRRELKVAESVARGIGPVCITKI